MRLDFKQKWASLAPPAGFSSAYVARGATKIGSKQAYKKF
jgi:hypothetical protein